MLWSGLLLLPDADILDYVDKPSTPTVMPEWFIETQSISIDV